MGALSIVQDIRNLMTEIETLVINEGKNTEELNLSKGVEASLTVRLDKINSTLTALELVNKIQTSEFTATEDNTTHVTTGFTNYDNLHDSLQVIDSYSGGILTMGEHFTENEDRLSIDLISWSIKLGSKIKFILYKNIK